MKREFAVFLALLTLGAIACRKPATEPVEPASQSSATSSGSTAPEESAGEILARIHFSGTRKLAGDTNAATLNRIGALPETAALKKMVLDKLATAPGRAQGLASNVTAAVAASIRPLLNDLAAAESFLEARANEGGAPEWAVAVAVGSERAAQWETGLKQAVKQAGVGEAKAIETADARGWAAPLNDGSGVLRFLAPEGWVVFGKGAPETSLQAEIASRIANGGKPGPMSDETMLAFTVDFPRLVEEFKWTRWEGLPFVDIQSRIEKDNIRSAGSVVFSEDLGFEHEAWKIPTKTIHDPLISFTAVQGIASWLGKQGFYQGVKLEETPNQVFSWAMNGPFYLSFAALPAAGSTNQVAGLAPRLETLSREQLAQRGMGFVTNVAHTATIHWVNAFPIIRPFVSVSEESEDSFIQLGLLPVRRGSFTNPPPAGLIRFVEERENLIYYDWEITQARLDQLKSVFQLSTLLSEKPKMSATLPSDKWVTAISKSLGNTATEITRETARELKLVRKSHLGLSAFEIMTLAYWMGDEDFPLSRARLPFLPLRKDAGMPMPGAPRAPAPPKAPPAPKAQAPASQPPASPKPAAAPTPPVQTDSKSGTRGPI